MLTDILFQIRATVLNEVSTQFPCVMTDYCFSCNQKLCCPLLYYDVLFSPLHFTELCRGELYTFKDSLCCAILELENCGFLLHMYKRKSALSVNGAFMKCNDICLGIILDCYDLVQQRFSLVILLWLNKAGDPRGPFTHRLVHTNGLAWLNFINTQSTICKNRATCSKVCL